MSAADMINVLDRKVRKGRSRSNDSVNKATMWTVYIISFQ